MTDAPRENETVTASIRYPDLVAHLATERCPTEAPHEIDECGEFDPSRTWIVPEFNVSEGEE